MNLALLCIQKLNILLLLNKYNITRKRLRSKYYPEKKEGQEKQDLADFYKKLEGYDYRRTICLDEASIFEYDIIIWTK